MKHTRQNAANTPMLAVIKRQYNAKIYKETLTILNETRDGKAVINYLNQFHRNDIGQWLVEETCTEIQRRADERARSFRHLIR